ncbi:MAG: peptidoglycan-binding domain-containing protein [Pseudomonadota bacterium]
MALLTIHMIGVGKIMESIYFKIMRKTGFYANRFGLKAFCAALAAMVLGTACVHAADADGQFSVQGIGTLRCSQILEKVDSNAPDLSAVVAWSDGALTAANRQEDGVFSVMPFSEPIGIFTMFAVNLCRQQPDMIYESAVVQVIELLKPVYVHDASTPVKVTVGSDSVMVYPQLILQAQDRLTALGMLQGKGDGVFGDQTMEALKLFQASVSLPITGIPDAVTLLTLLSPSSKP